MKQAQMGKTNNLPLWDVSAKISLTQIIFVVFIVYKLESSLLVAFMIHTQKNSTALQVPRSNSEPQRGNQIYKDTILED